MTMCKWIIDGNLGWNVGGKGNIPEKHKKNGMASIIDKKEEFLRNYQDLVPSWYEACVVKETTVNYACDPLHSSDALNRKWNLEEFDTALMGKGIQGNAKDLRDQT